MRYAIVSDIHANLQAWNAVLTDLGSNRIDKVICLGDIIGYGPDPADALASVYAHVDTFVLGNHDAVICGKLSAERFNARARQLISWTAQQLDRKAVQFMGTLPLTLAGDGFRCAHGEFARPAAFGYVIDPHNALPSWSAVPEPLLFVGHSHTPGIFVLGASGTPHALPPQDFVLEPGKRFLVNVGSVGYPRDGDSRASYAIYDTREASVVWRRIPFDLDAYRAALRRAGLPDDEIVFLREDPRRDIPPVRELLSFSPATRPEEAAAGAVDVMEITDELKRRVSHWRLLALGVLGLTLTGAALAGGGLWYDATRSLTQPRVALPPRLILSAAGSDQNLLPELPALPGNPDELPGWRLHLGNRRAQHIHTEHPEGQASPTLIIRSRDGRCPIQIEAPPLTTFAADIKLMTTALFRKSPDFQGHIAIDLSLTKVTDGAHNEFVPSYRHVEPRITRADGWKEAKVTTDFPAETREVAFAITGQFVGTVEITNVRMTRTR